MKSCLNIYPPESICSSNFQTCVATGQTQHLTCVSLAAVGPGHCADDVQVLEQSYACRLSEVGGRPAQPFDSSDGDPRLAGLQHHHHCIDVGDGDAGVLTETPGDTERRMKPSTAGQGTF